MKRLFLMVAVFAATSAAYMSAQTKGYAVSGKVIDRQTREGIPFAAVIVVGVEGSGVLADSTGVFSIPDVKPGISQFSAIQLGYRTVVTPEYKITPYTPFIEIEMEEDTSQQATEDIFFGGEEEFF